MHSNTDIKNLIEQGENSSIEFKRDEVRPESIAKEMVAFSNSSGGTIFIGIEDNSAISGINKKHINDEWVSNIARQNCIPAISIEYQEITIENKKIAVISIPKGIEKPYQTNKFQFLIRVGSTNRVASQMELMRLFQQGGMLHYDATTIENTSLKDINLIKIDNYFSQYNIDFATEDEDEKIKLLQNTDILGLDKKLTIAGNLIFGINPQRHLFNASISFAHFKGNEIDEELIDKQVIVGTIDQQIDSCIAVIKNNIKQPSKIQGSKTIDTIYLYPDKVYRELITNAVIHRNYSISGSRIRIFMFDNRIEFHSPGKLPNSVSIEKLKVGVSYSINPIILKFMENLRYVDKLGRGLPMVYNEATKNNKRVEFKEIGEEFIVTLYF